jgi:hypothetical protein
MTYPISGFKKTFLSVLFALLVLPFFSYAATRCVWTRVDKIVAVGDLHGNYDGFVTILKSTDLIDDELNWIGGNTHLVQLGDIMDRGDDAKKIFDLLMELEKQAETAGGYIHVLIGNHEEINILGLAFGFSGYVTVKQFVSFLPDNYRKKMEKDTRTEFENQKISASSQESELQEALQKFWIKTMTESLPQEFYHENFMDNYGKWILKKNAAIKINNIIFAHGGINKKYSEWKLVDINETLRRELSFLSRGVSVNRTIAYQPDSPLWYRDFAREDENGLKEDLEYVLKNLNADYMVIGHTVIDKANFSAEDLSHFNGKVWAIDTGISEAYRGELSALIIKDGKFHIWGEFN